MARAKIEAIITTWLMRGYTRDQIRAHLEDKWLSFEMMTADYETAIRILGIN